MKLTVDDMLKVIGKQTMMIEHLQHELKEAYDRAHLDPTTTAEEIPDVSSGLTSFP